MTPSFRVKLGLMAIATVLLTFFAWNVAQGQMRPPGFRPPGVPGPMGPRQGMPGIGPNNTVWTCPSCGYKFQGAVPPSTCPGCRKQMNNGMGAGIGHGVPGSGGVPNPNPAMNPGMNPPTMPPPGANTNPAVNQPAMNPPATNPAAPPMNNPFANNLWTCSHCGKEIGRGTAAPPDRCPHCGARILNGVSQPGTGSPGDGSADSSSGATKSSKKWLIGVAVGAGILVVLGMLLGGTWLVVHIVRGNGSASRPRRRRRPIDYDD